MIIENSGLLLVLLAMVGVNSSYADDSNNSTWNCLDSSHLLDLVDGRCGDNYYCENYYGGPKTGLYDLLNRDCYD